MTATPTLRLSLAADGANWIDALAETHDGRVGLDVVLADLNRQAVPEIVPVSTANYGFGWNDVDADNNEWWPQGITTSADASDADDILGRRIVTVAWYAKAINKASRGTRLSFIDITDAAAPRYRHVRLVEPTQHKETGEVSMKPVRVHAGGIAWYGRSILVADTLRGFRVFGLDDFLRIEGGYDGYSYVLPQRTAYQAMADEGFDPFRWSFVSIDRSGAQHRLIAGEYGVNDETTRLVAFGLDAESGALAMTAGVAPPLWVVQDGLSHMQGATIVDGMLYVSTSRGRHRRGSMWTWPPGGAARQHKATLSVGPEDLAYWPQRDQLWSVSEYPGQRYVYAMPRSAFS